MVAAAQSIAPSAYSESKTPTSREEIEQSLVELAERAQEFARLPARAKAGLVRECMPRVLDVAEGWVRAGCEAKGLTSDEAGEEWLAGPMPTMRMLRLLAESLDAIAARGKPPLGCGARVGSDGRLRVDLFPSSKIDQVLFTGFSGYAVMEEGVTVADAVRAQAEFYSRKDPAGGVALVLGAGNVSSIPPMDVLTKMFIEGFVCVLKMNPVNEWVGPFIQRAFAPLISRGFLRVVYGGAEEGKLLTEDERVVDVHITGSDKTHDVIVWGPPGPERKRRLEMNDPILKKPISSELGNVSPVAIVPYAYSESELWYQARSVVSMVANNGSFNCNAAKLIITARGWPQKEQFFSMIERALRDVPTRRAYYPGAFDRYRTLTEGRDVLMIGENTDEHLAWTLIRGVDADNPDDPIFSMEPFCSVVSETEIASNDAVDFLTELTPFLNDTVWGTLNACIVIHPELEKDGVVGSAFERCISELRYGTVAINVFPAVCYGATTMPWGGHPSATLDNIQSGVGWVHNTFMLGCVEKSVVRGPIKSWPDPVWFAGSIGAATKMGPELVAMERGPSWLKVPGLIFKAIRG